MAKKVKASGKSPKVKVTPTAAGKDKFSFGDIPKGEAGWKRLPYAH